MDWKIAILSLLTDHKEFRSIPADDLKGKLVIDTPQCMAIDRIRKGGYSMLEKRALITGVTGQDGAYLAEVLLEKGYEVHGVKRRSSSFNTRRIDHLYQDPHQDDVKFKMHFGDMTDATNLIRLVQTVQPTEIYNLAAQSHVHVSFETPEYTANTNALGTLRILGQCAYWG